MKYLANQKKLEDYLIECVTDENLGEIWYLLHYEDFDPSFNDSYIIYHACTYEKKEALKVILKDYRMNLNGIDSAAIRVCLRHKSVDIVKILLKDSRLDHDKVISDIMFHDDRNSSLIDLFYNYKAEVRNETIDKILENS